ncbi:MFS general substrate transporter [Mycena capillaripes]|nr:MFS general substrate transporter [Mycena capillaripes]
MGSSIVSVDKEKEDDLIVDEVKELALETVHATEKYTQADFDRVLRKQDRMLMPLMWFAYGIQQVDKTALSTQATFGIIADTHMKGNDYAWLSTILFICFLLGEFPGNWIMQRFSVGKTLAITMFCWGTIVFCTAAARNWRDLMIMRAFQGLAESIANPAFLIITGSISILVSIICFFFLGTPREVVWLSPEEKKIQAARVAHNNTGSDAQKRPEWKWSQVAEAFKDPRLYFFFFVTVSQAIPVGGINTFGNLIYVGLGFSPLDTLVKGTLPQSGLGIFWAFLCMYMLYKFKHMRFYFILISIIPAFVGMLVLSLVPTTKANLWPKWGAFFITATGPICVGLVWSLLSTNVAGRTKKSVISIVIFVAYCCGNAVGAQVFQAKWAPRYRPSTVIVSVMFALEFILIVLWRVYYVTMNSRRAAKLDARGVSTEERIRLGSLMGETDITDLQNEYFVYDY